MADQNSPIIPNQSSGQKPDPSQNRDPFARLSIPNPPPPKPAPSTPNQTVQTPPPPIAKPQTPAPSGQDLASRLGQQVTQVQPVKTIQKNEPPAGSISSATAVIRTMQSDIEALSSGKTPIGESQSKQLTPVIKPASSSTESIKTNTSQIKPTPALEPQKTQQPAIKMPVLTSPSPISTPTVKPIVPGQPEQIDNFSIQPKRSHSWLIWLLIVLILLALGTVGWYFGFKNRQPSEPESTPILTPTETPATSALERIFGTPTDITLSRQATDTTAFTTALQNTGLAAGQKRIFKITDEEKGSVAYTLGEFLKRFGANLNDNQQANLYQTTEWYYGLHGQLADDGTTVLRKPFIVAQISDPVDTQNTLSSWETTMIQDFSSLFDYTTQEIKTFNSDIYGGAPMRYVQMSDRNSGIAYTITNGKFLVIASSKDSFRGAVDQIIQSPANP